LVEVLLKIRLKREQNSDSHLLKQHGSIFFDLLNVSWHLCMGFCPFHVAGVVSAGFCGYKYLGIAFNWLITRPDLAITGM